VGQHILLDQEVGRTQGKVQGSGVGNWPQWIMRCHTNVISLCHCRNLLGFPQPTTMTEIRLDDVTSLLLEKLTEAKAGDNALSRRNWHRRSSAYLRHSIH